MSQRATILSAALLALILAAPVLDAAELRHFAQGKPVQPARAKSERPTADGCLTTAQRRSVSASGKVVPLSKAIRAARARRSEVVDARLCRGPQGLVYMLTLLAHDGKVTRATVDAASGQLTDGG
jgi:uncharacterized membrane protein YkoI